ncbi:MAG: primosomal protein N' [Chloroflexota bacterium]
MAGFARIAVNVPSLAGVFIEGTNESPLRPMMAFDYEVPRELEGHVGPGHLVVVPFTNRRVQGVVLSLVSEPAVQKTKAILQLADPEPVLNAAQISLAEWLASRTLAPIGAIIGLFLPPGLAQQADTLFEVRGSTGAGPDAPLGTKSKIGPRLIDLLRERGPLRGRQIDRLIPRVEWRPTAHYLVRGGVLSATAVLPPASVRPKFVRTAELGVSPEAARLALDDLGSTAATRERRRKALEYLLQRPAAVNVSWVYAESGCKLTDLQELAEHELIVLREQEVWRDPLGTTSAEPSLGVQSMPTELPVLTAEQQNAWEAIHTALGDPGGLTSRTPFLLQGVTGSGKTELYLRAALEVVRGGRQAMVLVPEIALTPQTVQRFLAHFPGQVGLIHSRLSDGERYDTWRRARAGALQVVIGPRSALFSPVPRLGVLVVDECHDASYHQAEPPFYDAVAAAQAYARMCGGVCIIGSATPSVVQRHAAAIGEFTRVELRQRVAAASDTSPSPALDLPRVDVVDMREELKAGNRASFSRELSAEMADVLRRGEQAILFLNRRGSATHVFCRNCGYVVRCPRCEGPLTYHISTGEKLLCHRCGYERRVPRTCPECRSADIRAYGLGTEKVEAEIQQAFPKARTLRWDWETTRQKDAHELILHHFASGRADILIGTQMLSKGLDLPRVTLVGIVMADVGLFLPDPFAAERVFQLLTQVAGRAGRSTLGGRVVLQTFAPEHYAIQAARRHDVDGFHAHEVAQRRRLGFPPFTRLLRLEYRHHDPVKAEEAARVAAASLRRNMTTAVAIQAAMIGPAPCFFSRLDGRYRWQIVLRGADPGAFLEGLRLPDWRIEVDPVSLL